MKNDAVDAIVAYCAWFCGTRDTAVKDCEHKACPLWFWRTGVVKKVVQGDMVKRARKGSKSR